MNRILDVLVIGGGMAGLSAASRLNAAGLKTIVIDKGRGPGGRMASRRADIGGVPVGFDHGAQYFTARDLDFLETVKGWERAGIVARWPAAGDDAWVGTPAMNAPIRAMAEGIDVRWGVRAERLAPTMAGWEVDTEGENFTARRVIVAVPAEQAAMLLADVAPKLAKLAGSVRSDPCWAVMAAFAQRLPIEGDVIRSETGPLCWAARNSAKPGRQGPETWVVHAAPDRTRSLLEKDKAEVIAALLSDFFVAADCPATAPVHADAHRWLYSLPKALGGAPARYQADARIGIAGDYCHSPRVEGAWASGRALAEMLLQERVARTS